MGFQKLQASSSRHHENRLTYSSLACLLFMVLAVLAPSTGWAAPPVANDDSYTTTQDTPLTVPAPGVLANDTDADGDPLTAVNFTAASNGTVLSLPDGSFTYTPDSGFTGIDSFTYEASDDGGTTIGNTATVAIIVNSIQPDIDPPTVTINQGAGQADPTDAPTIVFDVAFSEPVMGFTSGDVTLSGTAGATTAVVSGSGPAYTVSVSGMTSPGTVTATIGAGMVTDLAGNPNVASTSTDNTVLYMPPVDIDPPTVTINQGAGQADPTDAPTIVFDVAFSEPVMGFTSGDVTLSGTAGATTVVISGSGPAYTATVSGMTGPGTVTATIGAGVVTDLAGNPNMASTSTDNTVTYAPLPTDTTPPVLTVPADITVNADPGQATAVVNYVVAATDDSDPNPIITLTAGLASGSAFPVGTTTVTHTATDADGNTSAPASFTVTVVDGEPPVFVSVPDDIEVSIDFGETGGVATWAEPVATDNAPGVTVVLTAGLPSGSVFPIGTTTIVYTATDVSGNTVTASFTVTVTVTAPGAVTFVVESPKDGSFTFSSAEPALNVVVNSAGGQGSSGAIQLGPGTYPFSFTVPDGFGVTSAQCSDAASSISVSSKSGSVSIVSGGTVTCTIAALNSREEALALIGDFLETRANIIISNGPNLERRMARLRGSEGQGTGIRGFGMNLATGALPFAAEISQDKASFAYSLRRARAAEAAMSGGAQALDPFDSRFDIWTEGTIGGFKAATGDGRFAILHGGVDYLPTRNLLLGIGVEVDWVREDADGGSDISGIGYLVGPYATARLTDSLYFDTRVGWGQSYNQISLFGLPADKFDGDRWLATAALVGEFDLDRWKIKPEARVTWFKEQTDSYVDSLGVFIPGVEVTTGQLEFGPTISRPIELESGILTPFATIQGIWTFTRDNSASTATGAPNLADTGLRGRIESGLTFSSANGASVRISGFYDGIGDGGDFSAWGGKLGIDVHF